MVWVSNHSPGPITVTITADSGGSDAEYTVHPAILLESAGSLVNPVKESCNTNFWKRHGPETLRVSMAGKEKSFRVQSNDHVVFYADAYEVFTSKVILL